MKADIYEINGIRVCGHCDLPKQAQTSTAKNLLRIWQGNDDAQSINQCTELKGKTFEARKTFMNAVRRDTYCNTQTCIDAQQQSEVKAEKRELKQFIEERPTPVQKIKVIRLAERRRQSARANHRR